MGNEIHTRAKSAMCENRFPGVDSAETALLAGVALTENDVKPQQEGLREYCLRLTFFCMKRKYVVRCCYSNGEREYMYRKRCMMFYWTSFMARSDE